MLKDCYPQSNVTLRFHQSTVLHLKLLLFGWNMLCPQRKDYRDEIYMTNLREVVGSKHRLSEKQQNVNVID
jgi:hypothetical protein